MVVTAVGNNGPVAKDNVEWVLEGEKERVHNLNLGEMGGTVHLSETALKQSSAILEKSVQVNTDLN